MSVWVRTGETAMSELDSRLEDLHEATATPITARRTWLECWMESYRDQHPFIMGVNAPDGSLEAVAPLAWRRSRGLRQIVAIGNGPSDAMMLPARSDQSAALLADQLFRHLQSGPGPWRLMLRHLVAHDLVAPHLVARLDHVRLVSGDVSPLLSATSGASLQAYISNSHRRRGSQLRNRIAREGLRLEIRHLREAHDIGAVLPDVERVYRRRDVDVGRASALDVPGHRDFFRKVVERHALLDQVRLTTVTLDGQLAAYVLCFMDGTVSRMWNCRFDPAFARFSPGQVSIDESVAHALAEGSTAYDFMRGQERYKYSYSNSVNIAQDLYGASGPLIAAGDALYLGARARVRETENAGGRTQRVIETAKRVRQQRRLR